VSDLLRLVLGALQGFTVSSLFVLALFIGFCVLFNLRKLKPRGRNARVIRNLDERLGAAPRYIPPDVPRGPVDQLDTPELQEAQRRKQSA
jgi:hypothetical protein